MNDGTILTIATNLGKEPVAWDAPREAPLFSTGAENDIAGELPGFITIAWLHGP